MSHLCFFSHQNNSFVTLRDRKTIDICVQKAYIYKIFTSIINPAAFFFFFLWLVGFFFPRLRIFVVFANLKSFNLIHLSHIIQVREFVPTLHFALWIFLLPALILRIRVNSLLFFLKWPTATVCQAVANITENHGHQKYFLMQHIPKHFRLKGTPSCAVILWRS